MRRFDREFAPTNRLRIEGTDHLLSAGHAVGVKRFSWRCGPRRHIEQDRSRFEASRQEHQRADTNGR
jgi:hypothetical protein